MCVQLLFPNQPSDIDAGLDQFRMRFPVGFACLGCRYSSGWRERFCGEVQRSNPAISKILQLDTGTQSPLAQ